MNILLLATGSFLALGGVLHSAHGEWKVLPPWLARINVEDRPMLRLAWHVWSLAYFAMGSLAIVWSLSDLTEATRIGLFAFAAAFGGALLLSIAFFRGVHVSQGMFAICVGLLLWAALS